MVNEKRDEWSILGPKLKALFIYCFYVFFYFKGDRLSMILEDPLKKLTGNAD